MASTYLTRTAGTPTLNTKFTISFWVKRSRLTYSECFLIDGRIDSSNRFKISFSSTDKMEFFNSHSNSDTMNFNTNRLFRDTSAWYHIVLAIDTTDATAGDRVKLYINGTRDTSFSSSLNPSQNDANNVFNENSASLTIGAYNSGSGYSNYLDGLMSHIHFIDGTAYDASTFGSTDSTTGEWKINTSPSVTYGNNGFFILKDGNSVTDQSGNTNNFTVGAGTLTNTEDNPSNVFATLNPLYNQTGGQGVVLANGNTRSSYNPDSSRSAFGTIAVGTGKYYYEAKLESVGTGPVLGVMDLNWSSLNGASGYAFHDDALNFGYTSSGSKTSGGNTVAYGDSFTAGDIIGVAIDLDNNKLYFAKNGTWQNSGDPTSGSTGTGSAYDLASDTLYTSACRMRNGGDWSFNFGNGYFGTTAISSEGTNASNIGKFEYDVPTGYTALSTKGLNE